MGDANQGFKIIVLALAATPLFMSAAHADQKNLVTPSLKITRSLEFTTKLALNEAPVAPAATVPATSDKVLLEATALINKGDYKAAYQLLEPLEAARVGDINFDYLFGFAGVESGNVTRGTFALERVLAQDPNNKDARAEIAKAHYLLGEIDTSKAEFKNVLAQKPDEKTKNNIEKLLTSIEKIEGVVTTYNAYLDLGAGWDSNISSAPSISTIAVPVIGGLIVPLDKSAREKADSFLNASAGISFRHPIIAEKLVAFGSAGYTRRNNNSETAFSNSTLDFSAGLGYYADSNSYTFALQDAHFNLDGEPFRHAYGGTLQWLYTVDANNQMGMYGQFTKLKYNGSSFQNADRTILGVNGAHVFAGDLSPVAFASLYGGSEDARDSQAIFLDHDIYGLRAGGQLTFSAALQTYVSFGFEARGHNEDNPIFLSKRKDHQYDATIGLRYMPASDWVIKPQFSYTQNDSNIAINDFERKLISINVRKDFNW